MENNNNKVFNPNYMFAEYQWYSEVEHVGYTRTTLFTTLSTLNKKQIQMTAYKSKLH